MPDEPIDLDSQVTLSLADLMELCCVAGAAGAAMQHAFDSTHPAFIHLTRPAVFSSVLEGLPKNRTFAKAVLTAIDAIQSGTSEYTLEMD